MFVGPACMFIFCQRQLCGPDFTHQNRTQANRNFHPYSSEFVSQHVGAAVRLKQQSVSSKKAMQRKKESKSDIHMKKRKQTENGKTPGSEQPVVKSVCGSLRMRRREASVIFVRRWMHNLQVGGNYGP